MGARAEEVHHSESEVLWKRVKIMLGIPPELDVESPQYAHGALPKEPALNIV